MRSPSAKLKAVRPFNWVSTQDPDLRFQNWSRSFSKLVLEIGCGVGLHPIQWAGRHPDHGLIAIERTKTKFQSFERRLNNHNFKNILPVFADALDWAPTNLQAGSLSEIFILYPNPYPKEKQANKRWYRSPFCAFLLNLLKEDGKIHFATNEAFLYEESLSYATEYWKLAVEKQLSSSQNEWTPRTHFEKKYLNRGNLCFDLTFRKTHQSRTSNP